MEADKVLERFIVVGVWTPLALGLALMLTRLGYAAVGATVFVGLVMWMHWKLGRRH